jgi:hypothetical protein
MESELLETLERNGFITEADADRCHTIPAKQFNRLYEHIYQTIFRLQYEDVSCNAPPLSGFNFLAGAEMRGDFCEECRDRRLQFLARFAALYADVVVLPLPLGQRRMTTLLAARCDLACSVATLLSLRPLIESRNVRAVVMRTRHCPDHSPWVREMIDLTHNVSEFVFHERLRDFNFKYEPSALSWTGKPIIHIEGPDGFFDQGGIVMRLPEVPGWIPKSWEHSKELVVMPRSKAEKTGILQSLFFPVASETTFQMTYGRQVNARYLTSSRGETILLDWFSDDEGLQSANASAAAYLTHELPIGDVPIRGLLKIRKNEQDAFLRYRAAVETLCNDFLRKRRTISRKDARALYKEQMEPALQKLRAEVTQKRKAQKKQIALGLGLLAVKAVLGAFHIPIPGMDAVIPIGGALIAKAASERISERPTSTDLYYLLKLPATH